MFSSIDDAIIIRDNTKEIIKVEKKLLSEFKVTNMEFIQIHLDVEFKYSKSGVTLHQRNYDKIILNNFCILDCNGIAIPMNEGTKLQSNIEDNLVENREYLRLVRSLLYLINVRQLYISIVVNRISKYYTTPQKSH